MRLGLSALVIAALATAGLTGCGDSETGSGGGGGGTSGSETGTGTGGAGGTGSVGSGGTGGGAEEECDYAVLADGADCLTACDALPFSSDDGAFNLCTTGCAADADCDTDNTGLVCDGALSACVYSCGAGAPGCPETGSWICDDAETGSGTLLCIPDSLDE